MEEEEEGGKASSSKDKPKFEKNKAVLKGASAGKPERQKPIKASPQKLFSISSFKSLNSNVSSNCFEPVPSTKPFFSSTSSCKSIYSGKSSNCVEPVPFTSKDGYFQNEDIMLKQNILSENQKSFSNPWVPFPGCGTVGRKIYLIANYYDLKCRPTQIYHYNLDIREVKSGRSNEQLDIFKNCNSKNDSNNIKIHQNREVNFKVFEKLVEMLKESGKIQQYEPIFDGVENIFTASKLPFIQYGCTVKLDLDGSIKDYFVFIKPVLKTDNTNIIQIKEINRWESYNTITKKREMLLILNTLLNYSNIDQEIRIEKYHFPVNQSIKQDVGEGLQIWTGYYRSVHLTDKGPAIVLNLTAKVFHKAVSVVDYISELLDRDITNFDNFGYLLSSNEFITIEKALKGVCVSVIHQNHRRKYYVDSVTRQSAKRLMINVEGRYMNVAEYFCREYKTLRFPFLPCFQTRNTSDIVFLPFEMCEIIEGQMKSGGCNYSSRKVRHDLLCTTQVTPIIKFETIQRFSNIVREHCFVKRPEFNLFLEMEPRKVQGRVLEPPKIQYHDRCFTVTPYGSWFPGGKILEPTRSVAWMIYSFIGCPNWIRPFLSLLNAMSSYCRFPFGMMLGFYVIDDETVERSLMYAKKANVSFVLIIVEKEDKTYKKIKMVADSMGLITQCITKWIITHCSGTVLQSIAFQINWKLGGTNFKLAKTPKLLFCPTIIIGADVVHSVYNPSIAAVVGSINKHANKYQVTCRIQQNLKEGKISQEIILEFGDMVQTILRKYFAYMACVPKKIICYRDGVSEGQFKDILDLEVLSIRKAIQNMTGYNIPLTFIIVQKRLQTKLMPENTSDGAGKCLNIPPGTVVDNDITYPKGYDFFLCSHLGSRGTSKPIRYTVITDDSNLKPDELQELTYNLCFLGGTYRCTSQPLPLYLADKAASRAQDYVNCDREKHNVLLGSDYRISGSVLKAIREMENHPFPMFYV